MGMGDFDESPEHDFTESPLHERTTEGRIPYTPAPEYAASGGQAWRHGVPDFPCIWFCSGLTGTAGKDRSGAARWFATTAGTPGSVNASGCASFDAPSFTPAEPSYEIDRYLTVVGYHEQTQTQSVDPTTGIFTNAQVWQRATWQIDKRCGQVNDIVFEWSAFAGGTAGTAHWRCADDGVIVASGDDMAAGWFAMGFPHNYVDADNITLRDGTPTNAYTATVSKDHALAIVSGTQEYQDAGGAWHGYTLSEKWEITLSNTFTFTDALTMAIAHMDVVTGLFKFYPIYDPGTGLFTSTIFTWESQWYTVYLSSFPILRVTLVGGVTGRAINRVARGEDAGLAAMGPASMICQKVWHYNPYVRLFKPARVCFSSREGTLDVPNTDPAGDNSVATGWAVPANYHGERFDNALVFFVGMAALFFPYAEGECLFEHTPGDVALFPGAGCPLVTSHDTTATPPESDPQSAEDDTRSAESTI